MNTKCSNCNTYIETLTFYPHLKENFFKSNIDVSSVPIEIMEDLPKSHLHVFYECPKCKRKQALEDITLLEEDEIDKVINKGYTVSEKRTVLYWQEWLKNKEK